MRCDGSCPSERWSSFCRSLVAHTGWHWMSERCSTLRQFPGPPWTRGALANGLRWLMAALAAALAVWAADRFVRRWMGTEEAPP